MTKQCSNIVVKGEVNIKIEKVSPQTDAYLSMMNNYGLLSFISAPHGLPLLVLTICLLDSTR